MSFLDLFRRTERRVVTSLTGGPAEDGWRPLGHYGAGAEGLSVVLACVGVISSSVAALPAFVYRREGANRIEAPEHPLARLIAHGPNPHMTWADFVEWLLASVLLDGNALAEIVTDERGQVTALRPIPWRSVAVSQLPSGRLAYDFNDPGVDGARGESRRLLEGEVLHLKDRSDDGFVGVPRLRRAAGVVDAALAVHEYTRAGWSNSISPGGVVEVEKRFSIAALENLAASFARYRGPENRGKAIILEEGAKWTPFPVISPEDAELLASRRFTVEELARVFQVPPPMVGDLSHGTFTNAETMLRFFAQGTLAFWCAKLEAEFARSVFSESERTAYEIDFDMSGLLRGDPETRWASHKIAIETGVLDPDEVRELEGWNARSTRSPARAL